MGFIGNPPLQQGIGLFSQDTFTGDGSTTTFDLTNAAPDGGDNDIQVFVDNVRQQAGASNAYTLGFDGSSEFKRITFTSAPESGQTIFVLNPGTKNAQQITNVSDNSVTTAKLQSNAVTTAKITDSNVTTAKIAADAITEAKIADDAISEEHLDNTAITGHTELSATAADDDVLLVFDTSAGVLKKIQKSNIALQNPTFSSVSPTNLLTGDGTGNHTVVVTGTKFDSNATMKLRTDGGTDIAFDSVSRDSATQLTGIVAKNTSNLTNANEPFDIIITNGNGLAVTAADALNLNASPAFVTATGTLGTFTAESAITTIDITAADPESAGNVTFEFLTGGIPAGLSSTTVHENGVSKFRITGTPTQVSSNTTTNFTLRASDAASNTSTRAFSITINRNLTSSSFTADGTFAVPSGVSNLASVLVVAGGGGGGGKGTGGYRGGGGGAGGLIFMPCYPVAPGGTITVSVGGGGSGGPSNGCCSNSGSAGSDASFGSPGDPGFSPTSGVLTAKGGGYGAKGHQTQGASGGPGGSGGGAGSRNSPSRRSLGAKSQPTQPGNSGAYGFGNDGGSSLSPSPGFGGGGGGAGGAGTPAENSSCGGQGGAGKAYTIADGTTSVTYASGGKGGTTSGCRAAGTANRGGGGDGGNPGQSGGAAGGKGVVIVRY